MTPTNTEALRLADAIECSEPFTLIDKACNEAAAELRRLSAEHKALQRRLQEQALQALTDSTENAELLAERDALKQTLHDELDGNLRLRELGGARPNESMPGFLERVFAERDALRADAERYRWLKKEHERYDPICHLSWKKNLDRDGSEWVNTHHLDRAIDAAMKGTQA